MALTNRIKKLETKAGIHSDVDDIPILAVIVNTREEVAICREIVEEGVVFEARFPEDFTGSMVTFEQFVEWNSKVD